MKKYCLRIYKLYSDIGVEGIDVVKGFKIILVQFWEDYSDREMEKCLEENVAVKWFCGFELLKKLPTIRISGNFAKNWERRASPIFSTL